MALEVFVRERQRKLQLAIHEILKAQLAVRRWRCRGRSRGNITPAACEGAYRAHGGKKGRSFVIVLMLNGARCGAGRSRLAR